MTNTFTNENGHLVAEVSFGAEEITAASKKAIAKLCQTITVNGFRKGKAPLEEAQKYLRNDQIADAAVDELLRSVDTNFETDKEFQTYVTGNKLLGRFRPQVSIEKFSNTEAVFKITYVLKPTVTKLGSYQGLKSTVTRKDVTDKDVDAEIAKLAADNAELVPQDGKVAAKGDTVAIDFTGLMEGKPFDGGAAKDFDLELGSNHFVPGFEDQVIGHKAGDKFDISLTMPENYPAPLTSKPVVFKVTLNAVKAKQIPSVDDAFATTLSGQYAAKNLVELKDKVKANLLSTANTSYRDAKVNEYLLACRASSEYVIPDEYLDELVKDRSDEDAKKLTQQGLDLDQYLKLTNTTKDAYNAQLRAGIADELKSSLVFDAIAAAEKLPAPTTADIEKKLNSPIQEFANNFTHYLKTQNMSDEAINNEINGYLNQIFASLMSDAVQNRVLELNGDKDLVTKAPEAKPVEEAVAPETSKVSEAKPADAAVPEAPKAPADGVNK
jgi:trigger factor